MADTWYPAALANALEDEDLNGHETAEIAASFSSTFDWYYGIDGNTPRSEVDFASVVLHELGHGLGFFGIAAVDTGNNACGTATPGDGCIGYYGSPGVYDRFAEDGDGTPLLSYANPSVALGDALTGRSGGVYFDGPNANGANVDNGLSPVRLYAPSSWSPGSSYSHLGEIFNGTPNSLMTYSLGNGESIHHPGSVTLGMFQDMGWVTNGSAKRFFVYLPALARNWPPAQVPGVVNGDFEDGRPDGGPPGWTEHSTDPWYLIVEDFPTGVSPHSGSWAAWLGGANDNASYVQQQVVVPTEGPYLGYWHWIRSGDICGGDVGRVVVDGSVVDHYNLCGAQDTGGWVKHVVDLGTYAGRSVDLQIGVETNSVLESSLFVDDVSFQSGASSIQGDSIPFGPDDGASASGTQ